MIPWSTTWSHWAHYDDALPSGPRDTSPSYGVTNPSLNSCQPNRHFQRYPQCTFIATQLRCDVWYTQSIPTVSGSCTISWSKEWYLTFGKATANELHDLWAMLRIGSCPSHHSPNDVIPLSMTSNVIVRKPWLSFDQWASQLEAH